MPNNTSIVPIKLPPDKEYYIPKGYHTGNGRIIAYHLSDVTPGTATADDILAGETAWVDGVKLVGSMSNQGSKTATLNAGDRYFIPEGYHNGNGIISANSLYNQTQGTASASNILSGKTAYVNGEKITGNMQDQGAKTITLSAGDSYNIPAGYHNGNGRVSALQSQTPTTPGTATAADIIANKTAWVNGIKLTGTLIDRPAYIDAGGVISFQDKLYFKLPLGAYRTQTEHNDGFAEISAPFTDIRPVVGYTNQNYVLENTTILGAKGTMKNLANQTLPRDGSTAHITNIDNFTIAGAGYCSDVTFHSYYTGFISNTKLVHAIYGLHPDCIKYGQAIGANPSGEGFKATGKFTGDATAVASQIVKGATAYVKGNKVTGTLSVNSALSFSCAAISPTEIEIYWTNPSKGPYSGVFVQMSTGGYPGVNGGTRKYTGLGTNGAAGARSSCKITGLQPNTTYYFTVCSYCDPLPWPNGTNLSATTKLAAGSMVFTISQIWQVPDYLQNQSVVIHCYGGGASGSNAYQTSIRKSTFGGGGGGYSGSFITAPIYGALLITIGAGGKSSNGTGGDGGVTSVSIYGGEELNKANGGVATVFTGDNRRGGSGGGGGGAFGGDDKNSNTSASGFAGAGGQGGQNGGAGKYVMDGNEYYVDNYVGGYGDNLGSYTVNGTHYCGGGAGALFRPSVHSQTFPNEVIPAAGGIGGGGAGGVWRADGKTMAVNGAPGTGGGGGGAYSAYPGDGGSGVVVITWG